jgi:signal peptidase I
MRSKYLPPAPLKRSENLQESIIYSGPSMRPTLKPLDILHVFPYNDRIIRCGDVVVFLAPDENRKIVHRVISINGDKIRIRGDNNSNSDPYILRFDQIIGRVYTAQRNGRRLHIFGGIRGRIFVCTVRKLRRINQIVSTLLHPGYRCLAHCGIFKTFLPLLPKTRVLSFHRPGGTEYHLLMGNRIIGRRLLGKDHWQIARPFRLFVDETSLPC